MTWGLLFSYKTTLRFYYGLGLSRFLAKSSTKKNLRMGYLTYMSKTMGPLVGEQDSSKPWTLPAHISEHNMFEATSEAKLH